MIVPSVRLDFLISLALTLGTSCASMLHVRAITEVQSSMSQQQWRKTPTIWVLCSGPCSMAGSRAFSSRAQYSSRTKVSAILLCARFRPMACQRDLHGSAIVF